MFRLNLFPKRTIMLVALICLAFIAIQLRAAEIPFSPRNTVNNTFDGAYSVHVDDVDGDGDLDLLGAARWDNQISWWENTNGDGSNWVEHVITSTFGEARSVYTADIDQDGDPDVVGAAAGVSDNVAWWENTSGDGSTWAKHSIDNSFDGAVSIYVLDIDRDGDLDVVGGAADDDEVAWFENLNSDGTAWSTHIINGAFVEPYFVHAGDIDRDGDNDVVGAGQGNKISWFEDVNGDSLTWSENVISNTMTAATSVQAVDIDRDGDLDILGTARDINTVAWWENVNGDGSVWNEHIVDDTFTGVWMAYANDLDQDGDYDVIGAAFTGDRVSWWENTDGDGTNWLIHDVDVSFVGAKYVFPADIDSDGDKEIFSVAFDDMEVAWWDNETVHRNTHFTDEQTIGNVFDGVFSTHPADIDHDGDLDIIGAGWESDNILWWENTVGDGSVWQEGTVSANFDGARSAVTADIDLDGDLDIFGAAWEGDQVNWWENVNGDASVWLTHTISSFTHAYTAQAADIDQDGDSDVVVTSTLTDEIKWWENGSGDGLTWIEHDITLSFGGAVYVQVIDMDHDGDPDMLAAARFADEVAWWENVNGDGLSWSKHLIGTNFDWARSARAADVDKDGDWDVVGAARNDGEISWWENLDGTATSWTKHLVDNNFVMVREAQWVDLDNDGDLDIYGVASIGGDEVAWWENTAGDASVWFKHSIRTNNYYGLSGYFADLDNDGDQDIIASSRTDSAVSWWENCGGQTSLLIKDTAPVSMNPGNVNDLFRVTAVHNGRPGDHDIELSKFDILLEESDGDVLTTAEANALIENLSIYLDDGSGAFEIGNDTIVTNVSNLSLTNGVQSVLYADGDSNVQIPFADGSKAYFAVFEITIDPASDPDWNNVETLQATLLHETSTLEDSQYDILLTQDCRVNLTAGTVINVPDPKPTSTPTATSTNTPTATSTATPTPTATNTPTPTFTPTPTATATSTPTATPPIQFYSVFLPVVEYNPVE